MRFPVQPVVPLIGVITAIAMFISHMMYFVRPNTFGIFLVDGAAREVILVRGTRIALLLSAIAVLASLFVDNRAVMLSTTAAIFVVCEVVAAPWERHLYPEYGQLTVAVPLAAIGVFGFAILAFVGRILGSARPRTE